VNDDLNDLIAQAIRIAKSRGLGTLAYLLDLAALEAAAQKNSVPPEPVSKPKVVDRRRNRTRAL
jgi:hypothetical protein